ncbi:hypothetical protein BDV10DRAFT_54781 [Aspergillus recurvatus]
MPRLQRCDHMRDHIGSVGHYSLCTRSKSKYIPFILSRLGTSYSVCLLSSMLIGTMASLFCRGIRRRRYYHPVGYRKFSRNPSETRT